MTLNEYQQKAMQTCMPSCDNFSYMFINLVGELGEFASKVAKSIRREDTTTDGNELTFTERIGRPGALELCRELMLEAGDIMWQLSGLCNAMGWKLEDVAAANIEKLESRKLRGVIDGSGDNR